MSKCKLCRNESTITYLGIELCDKHWELSDDPMIRKKLKLGPIPISKGMNECSIEVEISKIKKIEDLKEWKRKQLRSFIKGLGLKYIKHRPKSELRKLIFDEVLKRRNK